MRIEDDSQAVSASSLDSDFSSNMGNTVTSHPCNLHAPAGMLHAMPLPRGEIFYSHTICAQPIFRTKTRSAIVKSFNKTRAERIVNHEAKRIDRVKRENAVTVNVPQPRQKVYLPQNQPLFHGSGTHLLDTFRSPWQKKQTWNSLMRARPRKLLIYTTPFKCRSGRWRGGSQTEV